MSTATEFVIDTASDALAAAADRALGGRTRRHRAISGPDAALAIGAARVVIVDPLGPDPAQVVQPVRWWIQAAATTDARVVLVSTSRVFGPASLTPDPDEWTAPTPNDPIGRAWRAAEALVDRCDGALVRAAPDHGLDDVAALVAWVAVGRHAGRWHLDGFGLDGILTSVARANDPLEAGSDANAAHDQAVVDG